MKHKRAAAAGLVVAGAMSGALSAQQAGPDVDGMKSIRMVRTHTRLISTAAWTMPCGRRRPLSTISTSRSPSKAPNRPNAPKSTCSMTTMRCTSAGASGTASLNGLPPVRFATARSGSVTMIASRLCCRPSTTGAAATSSKRMPTASSTKASTRTSARAFRSGILSGTWPRPPTPTAGPLRSRFH